MLKMIPRKKSFYPKDRKAWRDWLFKNHKTEKKIYLIKYKRHTKKPSITHQESMDEAICFGWIDTIVNRIDDKRYSRCFVRRNENSRWSRATQSYARRLIKEGKMAPEGLKMYKQGLKKPVIDHGLPRNPKTPLDLEKALDKNKKARERFDNLAPSYRRYGIYWIEKAKREETRKKRIKATIQQLLENKKPGL